MPSTATDDVWNTWSSTSTTTDVTHDVWYSWNCTATDTQNVWVTWVVTSNGTDSTTATYNNYPQREGNWRTQEEINRQEHERQQRIAEAKLRNRERAAANKRAMELLLTHLTKKQQEQLAKHNYFIVQGGKSKRKYRIRSGKNHRLPMANIDVLHANDNKKVDHRLCFHCNYDIPQADSLLAQKLMLEADEDRALELANRHAA